MDHLLLGEAIRARAGVHVALGLSRGLLERSLRVNVAGHTSTPVSMGKGGKQGGRATPNEWNAYLELALGPLFSGPLPPGAGWTLDDAIPACSISHVVWADNIYFLASSPSGFRHFAALLWRHLK